MPTFVVDARCKNNGKCEEICPSDIMRIDPVLKKAYNSEPDMCWECLSCVKTCPEQAIEVRPYADISPLGAEMSVKRDEKTNTIEWNIKYRDSRKKSFVFPIRTAKWDSIGINQTRKTGGIDGQELFLEPEGLMTGGDLPTLSVKSLRRRGE